MAKLIKTAEEHVIDLKQHRARQAADAYRDRRAAERLALGESMRDDVISALRNTGRGFDDVHVMGGPTAVTLNKWLDKKTRYPQIGTARAALRAVGLDLVISRRSPV